MTILNFGSCNIDNVYAVPHIVAPGETISATGLSTFAGGKGLNQSVALARAGGVVCHAGCIGADGLFLKEMLLSCGVDVSYLREVDGKTGHAIIMVDEHGQNSIIVCGGANQDITDRQITETLSHFEAGDIVVLQNEINGLDKIIRQAHAKGMKIVLNPSPIRPNLEEIPLDYVWLLVANQTELAQLSGEDDVDKGVRKLMAKAPQTNILVTLGTDGCVLYSEGEVYRQSAFMVEAKDTTAAGDTFTGYVVSCLAKGMDKPSALRYASMASAICVTREGAAPSIPTMHEVEAFAGHIE